MGNVVNGAVDFFKHNNARIGNSVSVIVGLMISDGTISPRVAPYVLGVLGAWGVGSWVQGAKNKFRPPQP